MRPLPASARRASLAIGLVFSTACASASPARPPAAPQAATTAIDTQAAAPASRAAATSEVTEPAPATPAVPEDLASQVERAAALGGEIYARDVVSAVAAKALLGHVRDPAAAGLAGWIALPVEGGGARPQRFEVSFFTSEPEPRVGYKVELAPDRGPVVAKLDPPEAPAPALRALIRARTTALVSLGAERRGPVNTVVLPGAAFGTSGTLVYVLKAATAPGTLVIGQHARVLVSPDGRKVQETLLLSKSDLEIPLVPPGLPPGARPAGAVVSHIVTPHPLESHVLASLQNGGWPIFVATSRGRWKVEGTTIEYQGPLPEPRP